MSEWNKCTLQFGKIWRGNQFLVPQHKVYEIHILLQTMLHNKKAVDNSK